MYQKSHHHLITGTSISKWSLQKDKKRSDLNPPRIGDVTPSALLKCSMENLVMDSINNPET
jgi:hypothetical protein